VCFRDSEVEFRNRVLLIYNIKSIHAVSIHRLRYLPISLSSCNLKAIWLSESQAQPLLRFQQDIDEETGERVLTCFLLPQVVRATMKGKWLASGLQIKQAQNPNLMKALLV
jgi:hypothetical protein